MKTGDIVRINTLGHDLHVIIGQAKGGGYWVQNLRTGALPIAQRPYVSGFMPKEMTLTGAKHYDYAQLACHSAGTNHSEDSVTHYSGSGTSEQLCGYHALANTDWRVSA
jgi:hypothetical protein